MKGKVLLGLILIAFVAMPTAASDETELLMLAQMVIQTQQMIQQVAAIVQQIQYTYQQLEMAIRELKSLDINNITDLLSAVDTTSRYFDDFARRAENLKVNVAGEMIPIYDLYGVGDAYWTKMTDIAEGNITDPERRQAMSWLGFTPAVQEATGRLSALFGSIAAAATSLSDTVLHQPKNVEEAQKKIMEGLMAEPSTRAFQQANQMAQVLLIKKLDDLSKTSAMNMQVSAAILAQNKAEAEKRQYEETRKPVGVSPEFMDAVLDRDY